MGNLINLATAQSPGATLISIANGVSGVWAMVKLLEANVHTNLISNPFLVTTNKYTAEVSIGEQRYVQTGVVKGNRETDTFGYIDAFLTVKITPQINSIGIINLDIQINIDTFTDSADPSSANRDTKTIRTNANVGNKEVLALGGLLKTNKDEMSARVPILGEIPILGWFFKSKTKVNRKDNLLVFISPRIVEPRFEGGLNRYSKDKAMHAKNSMKEMVHPSERRDPIHRWFFKDTPCENTEYIDNFIAKKYQAVRKDTQDSIYYDNTITLANNDPEVSDQSASDQSEQQIQSEQKNAVLANTTVTSEHKQKKRSIADFMPAVNKEDVA